MAPHESEWHSVQLTSPFTASGWILATLLVFAQAWRKHSASRINIIEILFFTLAPPFAALCIEKISDLHKPAHLVVEIGAL